MIGNSEDTNFRQICVPLQVDFQVYHLKDEEDDEVANTARICPLQKAKSLIGWRTWLSPVSWPQSYGADRVMSIYI